VFLSLFLLAKCRNHQSQPESKTLLSIETFLEDKDSQIFDPKVSFDLYELHNLAQTRYMQLNDSFNVWGSNLAQFLVPQVYNFPEFVHWCAQRYIASTRSLVNKNGTLLFDIMTESISRCLGFQNSTMVKLLMKKP
jgi:hypothetical protein